MSRVKRKCIFIIVDGLGDLPVAELSGLTPLESAYTPNLDILASTGSYGQVDPIEPGTTPNTHSGTGLLLGLDPAEADRLKRGPVEAAGAGRVLQAGDVAARVNFASVKPASGGFVVTDRRAGRITRGALELSAAIGHLDLGDGVHAEFQSTDQHRGVLILSGAGLDAGVSDTDPGDRELPAPQLKCRALLPVARKTAEKMNVFARMAHQHLQDHPVNKARAAAGMAVANGVITRGAGAYVPLHNVIQESGLSAALISACNTVRGLARMFDFEVITDTRFTGDIHTDIDAKIQTALAALEQHDLVFVHIKAPDVFAHDRQPLAKRDFLQRLDKAMAPLIGSNIITALAADHTTDSNTGLHTADPVPALLRAPGQEVGVVSVKFGEQSCRDGTMERQSGSSFLQKILQLMTTGSSA